MYEAGDVAQWDLCFPPIEVPVRFGHPAGRRSCRCMEVTTSDSMEAATNQTPGPGRDAVAVAPLAMYAPMATAPPAPTFAIGTADESNK
jgi:hypothetical protein